jgi:SHS2 domain-containing protein
MERWEHFPHGTDVGIRGYGPTPAAAFGQAGRAMTAAMTGLERVEPRQAVVLECAAASLEELFFDWIDALAFEMSTRRMVFVRFEVELDDCRLRASVWGEPIDLARHEPGIEIKGPTYAQLRVGYAPAGGWVAQCVVDV